MTAAASALLFRRAGHSHPLLAASLLTLLLSLPCGSAAGGTMFFGEREKANRQRSGAEPQGEQVRRACAAGGRAEQLLSSTLRGLGGEARFTEVRFTGLASLTEAQLFELLGGAPQGPLDTDAVAGLLVQLEESGLFASATPLFPWVEPPGPAPEGRAQPERPLVNEAAPDAAAEAPKAAAAPAREGLLVIRLVENPTVKGVTITGLQETLREDVLRHLFEAPSDWEVEHSRAPRTAPARRGRRGEEVRCQSPLPDRSWLAEARGETLRPGLVWHGLGAALERTVRWLQDEGYALAAARARLTSDGQLTVELDEGHLSGIEVRGLPEQLAQAVTEALGFQQGAPFSSGELRRRLHGLQRRFPFLERQHRRVRTSAPEARQEQEADGSLRIEVPRRATRVVAQKHDWPRSKFGWTIDDEGWDPSDDWGLDLEFDDDGPRWRRTFFGRSLRETPFEVDERGQVILWMHADLLQADTHWIQLLRHTPSTGFAPGLASTLHLWDPNERVNVGLDGAFAINTKRTSHDAPEGADLLTRLAAQEKVDWLFGARFSIPALRVAELGGQLYALTDTSDAWRLTDAESYFYSALLNRADRDYYRRAGATALLTLHLFEQLTLGAELRRDRYDSLVNPRVWSLFNSDQQAAPTAPVTAGQVGSLLLRFEWSTEAEPLHRVGSLLRHAETSLVDHPGWPGPSFATLGTLELGNHELGSDPGIDYLKVVSDNRLRLELGDRQLLTFRLRAAGGRDLPLQKQEALGGWNALRGYDFKELRGDGSLLGTVELRHDSLGGFLDLGAVHQAQVGWSDPRPAAGLQLFFGKRSRLELAWRLDGRAKLAPDARVLVGWEL
jgi:hypothetical protein